MGAHGVDGEANVAIVRALLEAFRRRDLDAVMELAHPEGELLPQGTAERTGRSEPYRGHEGVRRYFEDVATAWDELDIEPEDYRAAGDAVIVFGRAHGRADGEPFDTLVTWVWKLRDGRVASGRVFASSKAAERYLKR